MATKYLGPIKSKAQADKLAAKLEESSDPVKQDAVKLLRRGWQGVAARPELAADMVKLAEGK